MADSFFRFFNQNKLLVVMYHGITENHYAPPIWTQLPVDTFKDHLRFLRRRYHIVTLGDVIAALQGGKSLPKNAALITFDDGLKNNFTVAFPILREMGLPATIFLTVDYIATRNLLWFDELQLLLKEAAERGIKVPLPNGKLEWHLSGGNVSDSIESCIESLKLAGKEYRLEVMEKLHQSFPFDHEKWLVDFGLMNWDDVQDMHRSGLVSFGVHTASHCILSELDKNCWEAEIVFPKMKLESFLGTKVSTFCFPNGRPNIDFSQEHINYLRDAGYVCAFSTENVLFSCNRSESLAIGRIPAGNDFTSEPAYFSLNTSGAIQFAKKLFKNRSKHVTPDSYLNKAMKDI